MIEADTDRGGDRHQRQGADGAAGGQHDFRQQQGQPDGQQNRRPRPKVPSSPSGCIHELVPT